MKLRRSSSFDSLFNVSMLSTSSSSSTTTTSSSSSSRIPAVSSLIHDTNDEHQLSITTFTATNMDNNDDNKNGTATMMMTNDGNNENNVNNNNNGFNYYKTYCGRSMIDQTTQVKNKNEMKEFYILYDHYDAIAWIGIVLVVEFFFCLFGILILRLHLEH